LLLADLGRRHEHRRGVAGLNDHPALLDAAAILENLEPGSVSCDSGKSTQPCTAPVGGVISRRMTASEVCHPASLFCARMANGAAVTRAAAGGAGSNVRRFIQFSGTGRRYTPALCHFASGVEPGYNSLWIVLTSAALVQSAPPIRTYLTSPTRLTTPAAGPAAAC
jgi:hypothetical protein